MANREAMAAMAARVAERVAATVRGDVRAMTAYPVAKTAGLVALNANENPHPLPPALRERIAAALAQVALNRYPDGPGDAVKQALVRAHALPDTAGVLIGTGSDEIIQLLTTTLARPGATVLSPDPTFVMYRAYAGLAGLRYVGVPLRPDFSVDLPAMLEAIARERPALVWLATPNNPTSRSMPVDAIERILAAAPGLVAVDEAYGEFGGESLLPRVTEFANLIVVRTLSKVGLAGVRLGYAVAHRAWIDETDKVRSPYNVNALTQAAVPVVLSARDVLSEQVQAILAERARLTLALAAYPGVTVVPSDANFLLVRVANAPASTAALRAGGILVKNLHGTHPLLEHCLRITVGTPVENDALLAAWPRS